MILSDTYLVWVPNVGIVSVNYHYYVHIMGRGAESPGKEAAEGTADAPKTNENRKDC